MNNQKENNNNSYKSLLLLEEISKCHPVTQRDFGKNLGIELELYKAMEIFKKKPSVMKKL